MSKSMSKSELDIAIWKRMTIIENNESLRKRYFIPDELEMNSKGMVLVPPELFNDMMTSIRTNSKNSNVPEFKTSKSCIDFAVEVYSNIRSLLVFLCIVSGGVWILKESCSFDTFLGFCSFVVCILCVIVSSLMPKDKRIVYKLFETLNTKIS